MRRFLPLLLAALLVAQSGCAHYSRNHRAGLLFVGGSATFIGSVIAADGAYCDSASASGECSDGNDNNDLISGVALMGFGLVVFGLAYYFKPAPASKPASTTSM
jgi:hypothetical protein